jgi:dTMP kinase
MRIRPRIYLSLPPEEAARRVQLRGHDLEDPLYLAAFAAVYHFLPEFPNWTFVDASSDADLVAAAIKTAVAEPSDTVLETAE